MDRPANREHKHSVQIGVLEEMRDDLMVDLHNLYGIEARLSDRLVDIRERKDRVADQIDNLIETIESLTLDN